MHLLLILFLVFSLVLCFFYRLAGAQGIGVNYGLLGNNLPPPNSVINLLKHKNIQKVRIFEPNHDVLRALGNSGIEVVVGVRNEDLEKLSSDPSFAIQWINTNVVPYAQATIIRYVSAGNEVIPGPLAQFVVGAMKNLDSALKSANLHIPVSTAIHFAAIGQSYPPSNGLFSDVAASIMAPIIDFLEYKEYPLLANVYPYFAYICDPQSVGLDYALGNANSVIVSDGILKYNNLFNAMVDTMYSAVEKLGGTSVRIVVSETGWPSAQNGDIATISNAQDYVNNVLAHVNSSVGTPKRPGHSTETYIFALFNENLKAPGTEQNFGMYYPDMSEVYPVRI
ncbi:putative glucan endo-1,3-beta-glucosidase GVI [Mercurialis annua]|uniref:putative glucan endo-1,3-beta-glucosidase GVI n=1 Tax=Mercurialis annua TaxID=3986 RepID=UPI00215E545C|nr:putative glucan endo-1,3-beta-glucosidase GVI [Mercurialis annua]